MTSRQINTVSKLASIAVSALITCSVILWMTGRI